VLVTADLVEPSSSLENHPLPGDLILEPNDWDLFVNGRVEGHTPVPAPPHAMWLQERGLDRLKGPGAWTTYEQAPAMSTADLIMPEPGAAATTTEPAGP
jgi:hypothetical protein